MATFTVTNTNDSGAGSLRDAVALANANADADTIVFDAALAGGTITLSAGLGAIVLSEDTTIDGDVNGDNKADITISGGGVTNVLESTGLNTDVAIKSLTLTDGFSRSNKAGGFTVYRGTAVITDTTIQNSDGDAAGGFKMSNAVVTIADSLIAGNSTPSYGGGIYQVGGLSQLTIVNTTVANNQSAQAGGGIEVFSSSGNAVLNILNSTVTGNHAAYTGLGSGNRGGGIHDSGVMLTIANSVIAENTSGTGGTLVASDIFGTADTANNSAFSTDVTITSGANNFESVASIGLNLLGDNGGTVETRSVAAGSVLIDNGGNALLPTDTLDLDHDGNTAEALPIDGRGYLRVAGASVDIGAVESGSVPAPLIVTTAADVVDAGDGVLSLREAVAFANANADPSTIVFAAGIAGSTITLTGGELVLSDDVTIDGDTNGDSKADITISGNDASRIFRIVSVDPFATDVDLLSLTLTNGNVLAGSNPGGAIAAFGIGSLDIVDTTVRDSTAFNGGAISVANYSGPVATVTLTNSTITGNSADSSGGGLYVDGAAVTLTNTTVHGNRANNDGGGIANVGSGTSSLTLFNSTVTGNRANADGLVPGSGGGVSSLGAILTFTNSVIADNLVGVGSVEGDVAGTIATATSSVFGTAVTITTNNGSMTGVANVGLGQLLDNGGSVLTRSPLDGSILIGAGSNAGVPVGLTQDGRGGVRIVGANVDAGAVEQIVNETIKGTAGNDTIVGGLGTDVLDGLAGNDILDGGAGSDTYFVDAALDTVIEALNAGNDTVNTTLLSYKLGNNVERVNFIGSGNFVGTGTSIDNRFQGGSGDDRFVDVLGGNDIFSGNAGTDTVDFRTSATGAIINLASLVHAGAAAGDSYSGIEKFLGSNTAADTMTGNNNGRWVFAGGGGNDSLTGGVKNDQLLGQGGNDTLVGAADRDSLDGGTGNDTMTGGSGGDVFVFIDAAFGQDTITDYQDGIDGFKVSAVVADNINDFTITNNGTTSVTLTLGGNTITVNGAAAINITAADFAFV